MGKWKNGEMDVNDISSFLDSLVKAKEIEFSNQHAEHDPNHNVNGSPNQHVQQRDKMVEKNSIQQCKKTDGSKLFPPRKSRKGPAPKLFGDEMCKICDSKATGFHYNVLSCEACKNFFRRAVVHQLKYECKTGKTICSVKIGHRPRCQYCRLMKCKNAGMKTDYINRGRQVTKMQTAEKTIGQPYRTIIEEIVHAWNEMEKLTDEDIELMNIDENINMDPKKAFQFISQCAAMKVRKIVHFCKRLPLWSQLSEDTQIRLIKGGLTEAMILFNTRDYDSSKEMVKFMDGKLRSKEAFYASGFNADVVDAIFNVWKYCHQCRLVDQVSIALITAAVLTSPDRQLLTRDKSEALTVINELHNGIINSLHLHLSIMNRNNNSFTKAITLLVRLRNISDGLMPTQLHRFNLLGLKMNPLLQEIYG